MGVEPEGSIYGNLKHGTNDPLHPYLVEGIGEDFVPGTYDKSVIDEIIRVSDAESIATAHRLAARGRDLRGRLVGDRRRGSAGARKEEASL